MLTSNVATATPTVSKKLAQYVVSHWMLNPIVKGTSKKINNVEVLQCKELSLSAVLNNLLWEGSPVAVSLEALQNREENCAQNKTIWIS